MLDLCRILGITKLNTTAYHPQCDGAVERFNRTLKTILRKHAAKFGCQWDRFLPGVLWAYCNTPHSSTCEKPSFLLYGIDCRSPTEAAYLPTEDVHPTDVEDYKEELMLSLSSARQLAASCVQKVQRRYENQYDRRTREKPLRVGSWVFIHFPQDESGRWRKLSRPWHGPYRITDKNDPDVTCVKVYHPQDGPIHVHQSRVCLCPEDFPAGYYWYEGKRKGPGRPPKWVDRLLQSGSAGVTRSGGTDLQTADVEASDTSDTDPRMVEGELPTQDGQHCDPLGFIDQPPAPVDQDEMDRSDHSPEQADRNGTTTTDDSADDLEPATGTPREDPATGDSSLACDETVSPDVDSTPKILPAERPQYSYELSPRTVDSPREDNRPMRHDEESGSATTSLTLSDTEVEQKPVGSTPDIPTAETPFDCPQSRNKTKGRSTATQGVTQSEAYGNQRADRRLRKNVRPPQRLF